MSLAREPMTRPVSTGGTTPLTIRPFQVLNLLLPERWDREMEGLAISFDVRDPGGLARHGRIRYFAAVVPEGEPDLLEPGTRIDVPTPRETVVREWELVHVQELDRTDFTRGHKSLSERDRWDGRASRGSCNGDLLPPERFPVRVVVELSDAPFASEEEERAPNESISRTSADVRLDVVSTCSFGQNFCIPAGDPDEPENGSVEIDLRTKNVPDGTPVRLLVTRIGEIDGPRAHDLVYEMTGRVPELQTELEAVAVHSGRAVLPNGSRPKIEFSNHDQHWIFPGNNFYAVWAAIGNSREWVPVSERDHGAHETDCLHMRFTVYIHLGSRGYGFRNRTIDDFARFFRNETKYFRSFKRTHPERSAADVVRLMRHRYIVIFLGHGWGDCWHASHEKRPNGKPIDHLHTGFAVENCCPNTLLAGEAWEVERRESASHYDWPIGVGCGNRTHYRQMPILGGGLKLWNNWSKSVGDADCVQVGVGVPDASPGAAGDDQAIDFEPGWVPRFMFHIGGCRTMVTDRLAEYFNSAGTAYCHGWAYSVGADHNTQFAYRLYRRWLKDEVGEGDEWDPMRFRRIYRELTQQVETGREDRPRLRTAGGFVSMRPAPSSTETALA